MSVVVVGNCAVDLVLAVDRFPRPGETLVAGARRLDLGGKGANQAVAARRFGAPVRLVAPVGDDAEGAFARQRIAAERIDPDDLAMVDAPTDLSVITVAADAENMIVSTCAAADMLGIDAALAPLGSMRRGDVVVLQGNLRFEVTKAVLTEARRAGATTLLNPAPIRWQAAPVWPLVDIAVLNQVEARQLLETDDPAVALDRLAAAGVGMPIVTLGAEGLAARASGVPATLPAWPVPAVCDTAGAGDAFCGALAAALALGRPAADALAIALRAAALTVSRPGTQSAFPSSGEAAGILDAVR